MRQCRALCQNAAYAAAWIGHIAAIAWDKMDVNVQARLSCSAPDIDADVVAVRVKFRLDMRFGLIKQGEYGSFFRLGHIEKICDVPARHNQHMTTREAVVVVADVGFFRLKENLVQPTQFAVTGAVAHVVPATLSPAD